MKKQGCEYQVIALGVWKEWPNLPQLLFRAWFSLMFEIGLEIVWNWILEQLTWNSDEPGIIFSKLWLIRTSLSAVTTPEPRAQDRLHLIFTRVQVVSVTCPQTPQAPPYHLTSSWPPRRRSFTKAKGTVPLEESLMMETKITVGYYSIVGILRSPSVSALEAAK